MTIANTKSCDDNDLITPEWVYVNFPSMGEQYSARQRNDAKYLVWENRFERFTLYGNPVPQLKTKQQVRSLLYVLSGIDDLFREPEHDSCSAYT